MKKLLIYVAIMLSIAGCTKDGETGPAGPKGDTGAQGQQGTQGQQGDPGNDGNANVTIKDFTSSWTSSGSYWKDTIIDSRITQGILDSGFVMVYKSLFGGGWTTLPLVTPNTNNFEVTTMSFVYFLNNILLSYSSNAGTQPSNPGSSTFKVVVISGTLRTAYPYLDWNNYEQVRAVLKFEGVD